MNVKTVAKYPTLCTTVEPVLLGFPSSFSVESEYSLVYYLLS